jgi:hypothetical protein
MSRSGKPIPEELVPNFKAPELGVRKILLDGFLE